MSEFIDNIADRIVECGLASKRGVSACTDAEIRDLEHHFHIVLPNVYKDFLKRMGMGAGLFMRDEGDLQKLLVRESFPEFLKTSLLEEIEGWSKVKAKPQIY